MASADPNAYPARPGITLPIEITAITAILALALALMAGAGAALYQKTRPANYVSIGILLIDQPSVVAGSQDAGPLLKLQTLRLQYVGLIKTETITGPVARQVHLGIGQVTNDLSAIADPTNFNISVVATAKSPTESNLVAQAATAELISYVAKPRSTLASSRRLASYSTK